MLLELQRPRGAEVEKIGAEAGAPAVRRLLTDAELCEMEKENMREARRLTNWKIYGPRGAAELLAINPTTLISRLKKLGIYKSE